jgi:hypothetical protein
MLQEDMFAIQSASMPLKLNAVDISTILSRTTGMLAEGLGSLLPPGNPLVEEMMERHQELAALVVGTPRITPKAALLFPKEQALEIMGWYVRLLAGLEEMARLRTVRYNSQIAFAELLEEYPGPALPVKGSHKLVTTPLSRLTRSRPAGLDPGVGVSPLTEKVGEAPQKGLGGVELRQEAARAGRDFRMGGKGSGSVGGDPTRFWVGDDQDSEAGGVYNLPTGLIKSQHRETSVRETEPTLSSYESEGLSGFDGESKESILAELYLYVAERLAALGKGTRVTEKIIMDYIPPFHFRTRNQSSVTKDFARVAKEIKSGKGISLSVGEWWALINEYGNDHGWSFAVRIRWLTRTGGLAPKVNDGHMNRVKALMKGIKGWMPDYDASRSESDGRHWLYCWTNVGLKLIEEFHQVEPTEMIEKAVEDLMAEEEY